LPPKRKMRTAATKSPELKADARDLHSAVSELVRIYQFRDRKSICYRDVSVTQCYALSSVVAHGPMMLNELAAELFLDKSTASRVVGSLVKKGYVRRSADPGDARALKIEVTAEGRSLHSGIVEDLVKEMENLIADYDADTRRVTIRLIDRLASAAAARFGKGKSNGPRGV
jgi:MarR family 2-MHQ and catechol resistance regulon transcriptional repressor